MFTGVADASVGRYNAEGNRPTGVATLLRCNIKVIRRSDQASDDSHPRTGQTSSASVTAEPSHPKDVSVAVGSSPDEHSWRWTSRRWSFQALVYSRALVYSGTVYSRRSSIPGVGLFQASVIPGVVIPGVSRPGVGRPRRWTSQALDVPGVGRPRRWTSQALDVPGVGRPRRRSSQAFVVPGVRRPRRWSSQAFVVPGVRRPRCWKLSGVGHKGAL